MDLSRGLGDVYKRQAIDMHSYDLKSTKEFRKNPYANHASLLTKEMTKNGEA
jgi:hypothetical protein